ncbi:MAG: TonB-dependent receptor [Veillonellales bacterium]
MKTKRKRKNLQAAIILSLILSSSTVFTVAYAEEAPAYDLDTVVVTATKIAQPVKDVPASVTVITAEELKKMNVTTVDQALVRAAGVYDYRPKGLSSGVTSNNISLRGFNGAGSTLVLLDGQPLNQAYNGLVSWSAIPVESVERIEVVKGSASALYGSNAMGGVINIITKSPQKSQAQVSARYESDNTWVRRVGVSDKLSEKWSYRFDYEKKTTDGYPTSLITNTAPPGTPSTDKNGKKVYIIGDTGDNNWTQDNWNGKLAYDISDKRKLIFDVMHNKYDYGYEAYHYYLSGKATNKSLLGLPGGEESNVYALGYRDQGSGLTMNIGVNDVLHEWYIGSAQSINGGTGHISDAPSRRWNVDVQQELQPTAKDRSVIGINYRNDWIHNQESYLSNLFNHSSITGTYPYSQAEGRSRTLGIFGQNEHKMNDKLSLTLGARYDSWKSYDGMNQDNRNGVKSPTYYSDRSDSAFSPKIALQYTMADKSNLHLSWGKSFQAPDLYTMYRSYDSISGGVTTHYEGNPDLKPQKVTSIELGWNKKINEKTNISAAYFHNDITNIIYQQTLSPTLKKQQNAGEGSTNGVELEISRQFTANWSGFFNYTYQRATISSNPAVPASEGKLVQNAPEQMLNFGVDYQKNKWRANLSGSYVSKRYTTDGNTDIVNNVYGSRDPYFIANTSVAYQWDSRNTVTFGVNNLFNRQYYNTYVAPDRSYSLQLTHKF